MAQRLQSETLEHDSYDARTARAKAHKISLKSAYEVRSRRSVTYEVKGDSAIFTTDLWVPLEVFEKMLHLADLKEEGVWGYIISAIEQRVERDLSNHEELGKLLAKRITEEARGISTLSPAYRESVLEEADLTGKSVRELANRVKAEWRLL